MSHASSARPSATAIVLGFATIYLTWGSTYLAMKVAVETMPPFAMASVRFVLAGLILLALNRARGLPRATARQWGDNVVIGVLLLFGGSGLVGWAGQFLPSGVTALLVGMCPFWMVMVEWLWPGGKRPGWLTMAGLAVGLGGAAWLAAPWEQPTHGGLPVVAVLMILVACASWAVGSIWSRRARGQAHVLVAASTQMIGGGVALGCAALVSGELATFDPAAINQGSVLAWSYLLVVGLVGLPVYGWLLKHSTPARVSTHAYVNPVVAVILGWLILDEPVGARTIVAAVIIVCSVVMLSASREEKKRVAATSPRLVITPRPVMPTAAMSMIGRSRWVAGRGRGDTALPATRRAA